jgi:hypothetical protein
MCHAPHHGVGLAHDSRPLATQLGASVFQTSRLRAAWGERSDGSGTRGA